MTKLIVTGYFKKHTDNGVYYVGKVLENESCLSQSKTIKEGTQWLKWCLLDLLYLGHTAEQRKLLKFLRTEPWEGKTFIPLNTEHADVIVTLFNQHPERINPLLRDERRKIDHAAQMLRKDGYVVRTIVITREEFLAHKK